MRRRLFGVAGWLAALLLAFAAFRSPNVPGAVVLAVAGLVVAAWATLRFLGSPAGPSRS